MSEWQQQLCSKYNVWHNFQDKKYFKKKLELVVIVALAQLKYSCNHHWTVYKKHALWLFMDEIEYTSWINSCTYDLQHIALL